MLPILGKMKISDIKPPHVGKVISEMKKRELSAQYILHVFNLLNRAFKDAVEYFGYLGKSPEIWFRSGATLEDVRRLLNHKSAETTQRYVHKTDDRLIALAKSISMPA